MSLATVDENPENPPSLAGKTDRRAWWAFLGPFGLFMVFQMLPDLVRKLQPGSTPEFWVYPLQTLCCAGLLWYFRREYPLENRRPGAVGLGAIIGVIVLVIWVAPQLFFHAAPRTEGGFDPTRLMPGSAMYCLTVAFRFARLVLVVPMLEEVFWRGFLLRYLVREDFVSVAFGTFTRLSFWAVTVGFMLEHSRPDWPAALVTGALYNWMAIRTRSLPACIVAHAVTNLLLGIYIMQTRQWGFW